MQQAITLQDLIVLGSIIGGILAASQALIAIGDRLWGKGKRDSNQMAEVLEALRIVAAKPQHQSASCAAQHAGLRDTLTETMREMKDLIGAIHATADAIKASAHAAELRDQRINLQLQLLIERHEKLETLIRQRSA